MFTIKIFRKRSSFVDMFSETRKKMIISLNPLYDVIILQEDYVHS